MSGDKGTSPALTAAIRHVLDGDVDAYGTIYDIIDKPLRYYIVKRYGRMDDDFRNEVVTRTHTFVFEHLAQYNPSVASIQTWAKLSSHNVALRVMTERFNLRKDVVKLTKGTEKLLKSPNFAISPKDATTLKSEIKSAGKPFT